VDQLERSGGLNTRIAVLASSRDTRVISITCNIALSSTFVGAIWLWNEQQDSPFKKRVSEVDIDDDVVQLGEDQPS
jgi:hypothetical protein